MSASPSSSPHPTPHSVLLKMSSVEVPPPRPPKPETISEEIAEGQVDSMDTPARYLAYANRLRTIAVASSRYLAYTSGTSQTPSFCMLILFGYRCR